MDNFVRGSRPSYDQSRFPYDFQGGHDPITTIYNSLDSPCGERRGEAPEQRGRQEHRTCQRKGANERERGKAGEKERARARERDGRREEGKERGREGEREGEVATLSVGPNRRFPIRLAEENSPLPDKKWRDSSPRLSLV